MNIAGKYMRGIRNNPVKSAVAGGLGAAGAATLGNLISGEAQEEGPGRTVLEALGAGAVGAAVGSRLPAVKKAYTKGAAGQRMGENLAGMARAGMINESNVEDIARIGKLGVEMAPRIGQGISTGMLLGAGSLGGMLGGGVANVGNMAGISGLQQAQDMQMLAQSIDPESYGSSNSAGARYKAPTTQYV